MQIPARPSISNLPSMHRKDWLGVDGGVSKPLVLDMIAKGEKDGGNQEVRVENAGSSVS